MTSAFDRVATFGAEAADPVQTTVSIGPLSLCVEEGGVRGIRFHGAEVIRRIDYPVRDADWTTVAVETLSETRNDTADGVSLVRAFRTADGAMTGRFRFRGRLDADGRAELRADLSLRAERAVRVNRAGFVLLHPLRGVRGAPLEILHPDGTATRARFPDLIAPVQPAFDIAALIHRVEHVEVRIEMAGEVFEMEDQRNWSDASFKTYCRPLSRPRPYLLEQGAEVRQALTIRLARAAEPAPPPAAAAAPDGPLFLPSLTLAADAEPGVAGAPPSVLDAIAFDGLLLRVGRAPDPDALRRAAARGLPITLEIVLEEGAAPQAALRAVAEAAAAAGLSPRRVLALPRGYLASHQPDGPWPGGPAPADLIAPLRRAFPHAETGGGMLTNFTEMNRCRPDPGGVDFLSFASTAIVHAADDASVLETLEALPDIFRTAQVLASGKPLRLGMVAIGMRSNPYGAAVAPNPGSGRVPMALDDPRQRGLFAAAWAVGVIAMAARGGVTSLALAMARGPLGCAGPDGRVLFPLFHVLRALAPLGGKRVEIHGPGTRDIVAVIAHDDRGCAGVAANLGPRPASFAPPAGCRVRSLTPRTISAARQDPAWLDDCDADPPPEAPMRPLDLLFFRSGTRP